MTSMSSRRSLEQIQARSLLPGVVATGFGIIRLMSPGMIASPSRLPPAHVWRPFGGMMTLVVQGS